MKNRLLLITGIVALILGATIFAIGKSEVMMAHFQHNERSGQDMFDHIASALKLNEEQKSQVKALFDSGHATFAPIRQKMHEVQKQLEAATANGQFDEAQVRSLATQQAQLMAEQIVEHERMKSKIFALLTPEQKVKAEELHKQHRRHMSFMGSH